MKNIQDYIIEGNNKFDSRLVKDVILASYISILNNKSYEEGSTFKKTIKYIKYDDILDILNTKFNYEYTKNDIKKSSGLIWQIFKEYKIPIQNAINGYSIIYRVNNEKFTLDKKELEELYKKNK